VWLEADIEKTSLTAGGQDMRGEFEHKRLQPLKPELTSDKISRQISCSFEFLVRGEECSVLFIPGKTRINFGCKRNFGEVGFFNSSKSTYGLPLDVHFSSCQVTCLSLAPIFKQPAAQREDPANEAAVIKRKKRVPDFGLPKADLYLRSRAPRR
jgi:hypothetical protein